MPKFVLRRGPATSGKKKSEAWLCALLSHSAPKSEAPTEGSVPLVDNISGIDKEKAAN